METLQTIWNILTTENEEIANIIVSPLAFIESYLYVLLFTTILKIPRNTKQTLTYVVIYSVIAIINMFFIPYPYYTFVNLLAFPLLVFVIFKTSILKSILSEVVIYIVSLIFGTPLVLLYTIITGIESYSITSISIHRIIYSVFFYLLLILIYYICKKNDFNLSRIKVSKLKKNPLLISNFIIGSIAIALQCYVEFLYIDYLPLYLVIISILVLITYFVISIISLFRTSKLEVTTEKLEEEQLYNQTLGLLYDNIRGFKHDFNNIVQGIGGYISTNNMDGLKEYYSQILDDCQRVNNLSLLSPEVINNPAIYSLLASKYHVATESGIKVNIEVFMDLSSINMKIYELTRVLGILLDNAIEASKQCEEKEINITMRKDSRLNKQLFIVENTYLNKDVNIDEIFEKGKTSKQSEDAKNHGLGLWEVRNLVKKRKNLNLYTTKDEKYFKQQFEIYCARS